MKIILMLVLSLLTNLAFAKNLTIEEELSHFINHAIENKNIVGTVVMVRLNGNVIFNKAFGYSDQEAKTLMEKDTLFRFASLTKPIVTVATLKLIAQGKLSLNDPVDKWIPEFTPSTADGFKPKITIKNLLTHTAGLTYGFMQNPNGSYRKLGISDGLDHISISIEENLKRLSSAPLLFKPGTAWNYSLATDVLGEVISRVESKPLPLIVENLVLKPLGLKNTGFSLSKLQKSAIPYADGKKGPVRMSDNERVAFEQGSIIFSPSRAFDKNAYPSGGAGMVGTADDYMKFLESIRTGTIELPSNLLIMLTSNQLGTLDSFDRGWGWSLGFAVLKDSKLANTPQKNGTYQWGGVWGNTWWVDPANKLSVVILTNTALTGMSGEFPATIRKIIYKHLAQLQK